MRSTLTNMIVSLALLATGMLLINGTLGSCSHPARFTPACLDAPGQTECK